MLITNENGDSVKLMAIWNDNGRKRLDCIRFRETVQTLHGSCTYARLVAIVVAREMGTLCICSPLPRVDPKTEFQELDQFQSLAVEYFPVVRAGDTTKLFVCLPSVVLRHEQIQLISGLACKYGLVNVLAYSNIVRSAEMQALMNLDEFTEGDDTCNSTQESVDEE